MSVERLFSRDCLSCSHNGRLRRQHGHVRAPLAQQLRASTDSCASFRNSTAFAFPPPETYWATFDQVTRQYVQLNVFERLWLSWYAFMQNDVLATGIMSFVMHEVVYFGRSLPWIIIDRIPAFNKYKIQNVRLLNALQPNWHRSHPHSKRSLPPPSSGTAPSSFS